MKMRNKSNLLKVGAVLLVLASLVMAQGARNGTEGASHLLIPQGARYLSGGGAAATVDGMEAAPRRNRRSYNAFVLRHWSYLLQVVVRPDQHGYILQLY
jgi:hypothetical protein